MTTKRDVKDQTLNLRVSAEFKERLAEEAAKQRRSITNYLEVTLWDVWQHAEEAVRPPRRR